MDGMRFDRQKGQVLITVAVMVVVLFGFLALALDGGNVYAGRRRMQNAADAGALAGARELCFGSGDRETAKTVAEDYAILRNGARGARVEIPSDGYTVTVVATSTLDTFFAGVIGIQTADVSAQGVALCGRASRAGGLWPVAFSFEVYSESVACEQEFLVFASDDDVDCAGEDCICVTADGTITETTPECEDRCDCDVIGPHMGWGERGWLRLFEPDEGYPDPGCANEGNRALACWLEEGHPGPISEGDCIAGQPGLGGSANVDSAVTSRINDVVNVILWDRYCDQPDDPETLGGAPGPEERAYHVAGFGCVEVMAWYDKYWIPLCGSDNKNPTRNVDACMPFLKAVLVRKVCKETDPLLYQQFCYTDVGVTGGDLPTDMELRAVSLVK